VLDSLADGQIDREDGAILARAFLASDPDDSRAGRAVWRGTHRFS
jgi:hypothetical protein